MLSVREAVVKAKEAANDFFDPNELNDLQLEEVEFDALNSIWLITLGFNVVNTNQMRGLALALGGDRQYIRKYKIFAIDANTSEIKSMKIRDV